MKVMLVTGFILLSFVGPVGAKDLGFMRLPLSLTWLSWFPGNSKVARFENYIVGKFQNDPQVEDLLGQRPPDWIQAHHLQVGDCYLVSVRLPEHGYDYHVYYFVYARTPLKAAKIYFDEGEDAKWNVDKLDGRTDRLCFWGKVLNGSMAGQPYLDIYDIQVPDHQYDAYNFSYFADPTGQDKTVVVKDIPGQTGSRTFWHWNGTIWVPAVN